MNGPVCDPRWSARLYDKLGAAYLDLPAMQGSEQETAFLVEAMALPEGARVLDVGCGVGRHAVELAKRGCSVTGVDASYRLLELGLELARAKDVIVNFMHYDARDLTFAGSFDAALSIAEGPFGILETDAENRRVLERMHAAVRPGGATIINVANRLYVEARPEQFSGFDASTGWTEHAEPLKLESGRTELVRWRNRTYDADELSGLVGDVGFEVEAIFGSTPGDFGRHDVDGSRPGLLLVARRR